MLKPTAMIIDDDGELLHVLARRCESIGLRAATYTSLSDALDDAFTFVPDIIVLDVTMPTGSGLEACERLATDKRLMSVPVVIMTGHAEGETRLRALHAGARYVRKGAHLWDRLGPVLEQELSLTHARPPGTAQPPRHDAPRQPHAV